MSTNNLIHNMRHLVSKALSYNIAEAAMDHYNSHSDSVELYELACTIGTEVADFEEGYVLSKIRSSKSAGEALGLPDGIAEAVKRCYLELPYDTAERAVHGAVEVLKGHALIDIL